MTGKHCVGSMKSIYFNSLGLERMFLHSDPTSLATSDCSLLGLLSVLTQKKLLLLESVFGKRPGKRTISNDAKSNGREAVFQIVKLR